MSTAYTPKNYRVRVRYGGGVDFNAVAVSSLMRIVGLRKMIGLIGLR
jgi:hypothetical protein